MTRNELRERVSEPEKLDIESSYSYYMDVTGNLEKAVETYELWLQTYPPNDLAAANLGIAYSFLGKRDKAVSKLSRALALNPTAGVNYANLAEVYVAFDHFDEARSTMEQARKRKLDSPYLHFCEYQLAFLRGDASTMKEQASWSMGQPGLEEAFLGFEANTAAYAGELAKAKELISRAVSISERNQDKEGAGAYLGQFALDEALFGNWAEAGKTATEALAHSSGRSVQPLAALALAFAGDLDRAEALAADLVKRIPEDTLQNFNYVPAIRAAAEVQRASYSKAIEIL